MSSAPKEDADVYVQPLVYVDEQTGLDEVHVCVAVKDLGRLADALRAGYRATLKRHLASPGFGGAIRFVILTELTPGGAALWETVASVEQDLKAAVEAGDLRTVLGVPLRLFFEYAEADGRP